MGKNCLEGYLTPVCATCPDWSDGSDPKRGIGCDCHFPIAWCSAFSKLMDEEQSQTEHTCKQCGRRFVLSREESEWYLKKWNTVPARCCECRGKNRKEKYGG